MRRTIGGTILVVTGCIFSPCCVPITLPFLVAALGGTAAGGWLLAHESAIGVVTAICGLGALGLGGLLLLRRRPTPTTGRRSERPALERPTRDLLDPAPAPVLSRLDAPRDCACCAPPHVSETPRGRSHSVLPVLALPSAGEDEAPLVQREHRQ